MGSLLKAAIGNQSHRPVDSLRSHEWNFGFHLSYQNRQGKTQKSAPQYFKTNFSIYLSPHKADGLPLQFLLPCFFFLVRGFPGGAVVKNPPANAGDTRRRFCPWVRKILWRRAWQPTAVFWPGESHGQRSLVGCCPRGHRESDSTERTADTAHLHVSLWPAALWTA